MAELFVRFTHFELFRGQHALGLHECAEWPPHWFVFILAIEKKGVRFETSHACLLVSAANAVVQIRDDAVVGVDEVVGVFLMGERLTGAVVVDCLNYGRDGCERQRGFVFNGCGQLHVVGHRRMWGQ